MAKSKSSKKAVRISDLQSFLDEKVDKFNQPGFIENDPISIPHRFKKKQDIEIAGFFAAMLAWGQRITVLNKCTDLLNRMDNAPHDFMLHHTENDLKAFTTFKHRTFNATDTLYFLAFLSHHYKKHASLETLFAVDKKEETIEKGLINFHHTFFSLADAPHRTKKHVPTPERKSTCKRLSMYLRWMVRNDQKGVDFGIWKKIQPAQLICPCDLHVERVARQLKLIKRKPTDWQTALELTANLRKLDPLDPVKYDFALFGLGIEEGWSKLK
ncbi:TIGR02757 family protein [Chryseotalea sanaruensis]|uniref:TIGR02757 family protein n=1 Tax=Chryseotalea sanaruensis TaxID=2482724 RepID=A0A401UDG5_9BACT|nr:TIGR02757 family protein [Chryseotalea sanaruensis]GCC52945.1 TIGR02757 family protein [Chryseotalea sanaruensis]